jgi:hypothetical protein
MLKQAMAAPGRLTAVLYCQRAAMANECPLLSAHNGLKNEMAFAHGCICSGRRRSDFASNQVEASNTAFRCRRGRMEMQQVGVDPNDLRAQPRGPLFTSMN